MKANLIELISYLVFAVTLASVITLLFAVGVESLLLVTLVTPVAITKTHPIWLCYCHRKKITKKVKLLRK